MADDLDRIIDHFYGKVGSRVRDARKAARVTQSQLGDAVNMTRSSITNLEAGRQRIPLHLLVWIAEVLGVEPGSLLPEQPLFKDLLIAPDLTEPLATVSEERMREFVQSAIAKLVTATKGDLK
jgi:transcriptional regulator with XRE-family HTH domain